MRDFLMAAVAPSAASTPEMMAQEFIIAVIESAPLAPPTTQPAPKRPGMGLPPFPKICIFALAFKPPSVVAKRGFCSTM